MCMCVSALPYAHTCERELLCFIRTIFSKLRDQNLPPCSSKVGSCPDTLSVYVLS